ncbi:Jag N-terminal domain-containing protein [Campylobacter sp. RM9344]|uniref:Jag N-terminal domain-containing protein n=1 Tax=Campylobacter californiensis TaxID=1032243 RepID=A0AAW3ZRF0_9BACT|nr:MULTISPECIES: Jag N-terminal domain-containing protein [unclassified Campylobacter]MBE2983830.1 Jag N-terminal domain-containing protein [Campylobacter sp. RM6883]MBE2985606.1 Jag N-terminal domain-containing protein [Campylobacter sp. RM12919]MBE2987365.1 Jag N-terminal domain-containing protein [Campylobacter sp. RM12920]MBE2994368.1 Jag N-terminal domain-containing protein [Campylobacter sp. RM6913]MBE3028676.1 Jag N-terminal domain-containing protein [Campylobacter sp. RM9344]
MRIEASNLQEAFQKAATELKCSVTELDIKVIQHPSSGFLGFFKKNAIIEADIEKKSNHRQNDRHDERKKEQKHEKREHNLDKKHIENKKEDGRADKKEDKPKEERRRNGKNKKNKHSAQNGAKKSLSDKNNALAQDAFGVDISESKEEKPEYIIKRIDTPEVKPQKREQKDILDTSIIDNFNTDSNEAKVEEKEDKRQKNSINFDEILPIIKNDLTRLLNASCFSISKIEVSKFSDECLLIELDGDDAALLIGKEGYRYKAISYLLHNWLNTKYNLSIRLEIAEFLKNQEAMIDQYLTSIIERVQNTGKAQTKPLDGVLVKIALEKLRATFPEKYVGIKSNGSDKFVVVNDFFKK